MREEDIETTIKVVLVGNGVVGKSSLIQRYCKGIFTNEYKKTLGVDFLEKILQAQGHSIRLMLWDTAGQEEFDALTKAYYRGAAACVIVFSVTDRESFESIRKWKKKVEFECGLIPMVLVQNKMDLMARAVVTKDEVESLAKSMRLKLIRTSVKEKLNVDSVFSYLANAYLDSVNENQEERVTQMTHSVVKANLSSSSKANFLKFGLDPISKYQRKRSTGFNGPASNSNAPAIHHFRFRAAVEATF